VQFKIISYAEKQFQRILEMDGITPEQLIQSLDIDNNRNAIFKAGEGAGQSGSFFFFSHDKKFIIKTMKGDEKEMLLRMIDDYVQRIEVSGGNSLLCRIYGLFTLKANNFAAVDFMIMQNTLMLLKKENRRLTFDLKGSKIRRFKSCPGYGTNKEGRQRYPTLMLDNNFIQLNKNGKLIGI